MRGIVVIDQPTEDRVVGWHVSAGTGTAATKASAWVLPIDDPRIARLLTDRVLVTTPAAAPRFGAGADVAGLAFAIIAVTSAIDAAFAVQQNAGQSPRWPRLATRPPVLPARDLQASAAAPLVRWVTDLLGAWEEIERERLSHPVLVSRGGTDNRALPPGWPSGATFAQAA